MKFLYENFAQLIFYDLNIETMDYSVDGSHEFIKEYPDPENKITLIEKRDLSDVNKYSGHSFVLKRKMFAVGSRHVRDDMDTFWCDDMDEFFNASLIEKVEGIMSATDGSIMVPHLVFFKSNDFVYCTKSGDDTMWLPLIRITKHKKGNVYGHCSLHEQYKPVTRIPNEFFYHYAYVGDNRVKFKRQLYSKQNVPMHAFYDRVWTKFNESNVGDGVYGYPKMHPGQQWGIKRHAHKSPEYINMSEMIGDLK